MAPNSPSLCFSQKRDRPLGQRRWLRGSKIPANVGVDIIGLEAYRVKNANCLGQDGFPDPISRHRNNR